MANLSGVRFESEVRRELKSHGFAFVTHREFEEARPDVPLLAVTNMPYDSIYGHPAHMEFLLVIRGFARDILVQAKQQNSAGSVDEKLPYIYANALKNLPERATLLVYSGDGWKEGGLHWIRARAEETDGFYAMNFEEFKDWLSKLPAAAPYPTRP